MTNPVLNGSDLYALIAPLIEEGTTDGITFLSKVAAKISTYIATHDFLLGTYVGYHGSYVSPLIDVVAHLIPESVSFGPVNKFLTKEYASYIDWFKDTLRGDKDHIPKTYGITWNIVLDPPHFLNPSNPPLQLIPKLDVIAILGDLSDIRTAEGFWAMMSDIIVWSVQASDTRKPESIVNDVTATDDTIGTVTWIPTTIPEFLQNFIFRVFYNANNTALVKWLEDHSIDTSHLYGEVDVPISNLLYQDALSEWKELVDITQDCKFYKLQDDDRKILLRVGVQL